MKLLLILITMALTILTLNVNGLRDNAKRAGFLRWLRALPSVPDVVCLQETHCTSLAEGQTWFLSSGFECSVSPGTARSAGCIVLFRPPLSLEASRTDSDGRFLRLDFSFRTIRLRVACIYAPNRNPERDNFFAQVTDNLDPGTPTILAGDFNTVFNRSLDRCGSVVVDTSRESSAALARLFKEVCCEDIWRYLHPSSSGFTWSRADGSLSSRIDLIGCPFAWVPSVSACDIVPCPFSDHCALAFSVSVPDVIPHGPGLWKLNVSILEEREYFDIISDFWAQWKHRKAVYSSLAKWWEDGKSKIKGLTISYCCRRSRQASQCRDVLTRLAEHLKGRVDAGCSSCLEPYGSVLEQLSKWDIEAAKGAQVQSRVRWVEDGEVSSLFFFRLEKKRAADRWVAALRKPHGTLVSSPSDLCSSFVTFYSSLFSASCTDSSVQDSLLANISSFLSANQASQCEGLLTLGE